MIKTKIIIDDDFKILINTRILTKEIDKWFIIFGSILHYCEWETEIIVICNDKIIQQRFRGNYLFYRRLFKKRKSFNEARYQNRMKQTAMGIIYNDLVNKNSIYIHDDTGKFVMKDKDLYFNRDVYSRHVVLSDELLDGMVNLIENHSRELYEILKN